MRGGKQPRILFATVTDLLVEALADTASLGFIRSKQLIERVLGRNIDLVSSDLPTVRVREQRGKR